MLATGAAPLRPPLPGIDLPGIFALRNLDNVDQIHAWIGRRSAHQAVIVGAGYIGLEMAENLTRRSMAVTLLEMTGQVMPPADPEMVAPIQEECAGRASICGWATRVARASSRGGGETITVLTKSGQRFAAEVVILAVGVKPDTRLAHEAGLAIGSTGGIRVDDQMRTSDPAIYAVGDAVEVREFVTGLPALIPLAGPANRQGRMAADVIAGRAGPLPRLAGDRRGRRLRPDVGHDRRDREIAPPGRHPLREVVHPLGPPRLVLSRRRADHHEAACFRPIRAASWAPRRWAGRASKSGST